MSARLAAQTQKAAGIPNGMRTATIAAVSSTGVTLSVSGGLITAGVGVLGSYSPVVGDTVAVFRQDSSWLILGQSTPVGAGGILLDQLTGPTGSITGTTPVPILTVDLPLPGQYVFDAQLNVTNTTTAGIPGFALDGTATPVSWRWASGTTVYQQAAGSQGFTSSGTAYPSVGQPLSQANWPVSGGYSAVRILGQITVSSAGSLSACLSQTVAGSAIGRDGSIFTVRKVNG